MADTITQTSTISMEIINSEQYKRANIRFSGIPNEKVRTELKNEGWLYSRNHNVWYPRNIAAENSMEFAKHIKEAYFPEPHEEVKIITEASEKDELAFMIQSGSTLKEILSKLSESRKFRRIIALPGGGGQIPGGILPETGVGSRAKNREIKCGWNQGCFII